MSPKRETPTPPLAEERPPTMEEATRKLATIVDDLEEGDLPLERALLLFEEGVYLAKAVQAQIDQAEKRVEELLGVDPSGRPVTKELDRGALSRSGDARASDPRRGSE